MKITIYIILFFTAVGFHLEVKSQTGWFTQNGGTSNSLQKVRFVNTNTGWIVGISGTIIKTTNGGTNWFSQYQNYDDLAAIYMIDQNTGWCAGGGGKIIKTTNGGANWVYQNSGTNMTLMAVHFADAGTGWVLSVDGEVFKTTNSGVNWNNQYQINDGNLYSSIFFINQSTGWFAGGDYTVSGLVYKTTNGGANWFNQYNGSATILLISIMFIDANTGYSVGKNGAILKTTNGGGLWLSQNSGTSVDLNSVYFINSLTGWIAGNGGIMIKTINGGLNWSAQNITNNHLFSVYFADLNTGWTIGPSGTILKTTNGGNPTGIAPLQNEIPAGYKLYQNYPNPFNPSTTIKFEIQKRSFVSLIIYNEIGEKVSTLLNGEANAGVYRISFNGSDLSSGVYFYRLAADDFVEVKKFVIIK